MRKQSKITGPTILTILRMLCSILFLIFITVDATWAKIVAFFIFVFGSLTDLVDGKWARKEKLVTNLGAFLDPLADKMLTGLAFLVLTYLNIIPLWVFAVILVRDFAVDGLRMMAAREGITIAASIFGKLKTTFQMIALSVIIFNLIPNIEFLAVIGNILLYISLILTVFSGADYLIKGWKQIIK